MRLFRSLALPIAVSACGPAALPELSEDNGATSGASIDNLDPLLSGCHGTASTTIPSDGQYVVTTFGGGSDTQPMSCGGRADGVGWYAASRQRYGCGTHLKVEANGACVVVSALDYGPDVCVERAAGMPILDVSPHVTKELFGVSGAGWSDHIEVHVTEVASSTPLGICAPDDGGGDTGTGGDDGGGTTAASCNSATLDRDVDDGTCVQAASDGAWYRCDNGAWDGIASSSGCATAYGWCDSATLGESVPPRTCVQSASSSSWFQCNGQTWVTPVDTGARSGPIGDCSSWHPL